MRLLSPQLVDSSSRSLVSANAAKQKDHLLHVAREASRGSKAALRTLVLHVGPPILATVRRVLGPSHPDVDDVAQDAVIALLDALTTFRGECSVVNFANRVALLTALASRRRIAIRLKYATHASVQLEATHESATPQSVLLAKRRRELLLQLLDEIPEQIAEALAQHFVLGMTVDEIAAATSTSENTVWSRLRLGKQALRKKLAQDKACSDTLTEAE